MRGPYIILCVSFKLLSIIAANIEMIKSVLDSSNSTSSAMNKCICENAEFFALTNDILYLRSISTESAYKEDDSLLKELQMKFGGKVLVISNRRGPVMRQSSLMNTKGISSSIVMHIEDNMDLERSIQYFSKFGFWTPNIKFLIIYTKLDPPIDKITQRIMMTMLQNKLIHTLILTADPENQTSFNIYSWSFSKKHLCNINSTKVFKMSRCNFGQLKQNPKSIKDRFNRCKLKVGYVQSPPFTIHTDGGIEGIEAELLKLVAKKMNFELEFNHFDGPRGKITKTEATGLFKCLRDTEVDIVIGSFIKTKDRCIYVDCSSTYSIPGDLVWCAPKTPQSIELNVLFFYIEPEVWIAFFLLYVLIIICIWLVSCLKYPENKYYNNLSSIFFWSLSIMLEVSSNRLPKTWYGKYYFGLLLCLGLYMSNVFNSEVTSILTGSYKVEKYRQIEDIFKYNLDTYYRGSQRMIIGYGNKPPNNVPAELIKKKWIQLENATEGLLKVIDDHISYCLEEAEKEYWLNTVQALRNIRGKITCMKDGSKSIYLNALFKKGLFLGDSFDIYLLRLTDHGFFIKWASSFSNRYSSRLDDVNEALDNVGIRLQHIKPLFIILAVGYIMATVAFILEVSRHSNGNTGINSCSDRLENLSLFTEP